MKLHTHPTFPRCTYKLMAPHLPPRWGSLGKRLLVPQDSPAFARAPPSPEPGLSQCQAPSRAAAGGRREVGLARLHWLCGPEGRREDARSWRHAGPGSLALRSRSGAPRQRAPDHRRRLRLRPSPDQRRPRRGQRGQSRTPSAGARLGRWARPGLQVSDRSRRPSRAKAEEWGAGDAQGAGGVLAPARGVLTPSLEWPRVPRLRSLWSRLPVSPGLPEVSAPSWTP